MSNNKCPSADGTAYKKRRYGRECKNMSEALRAERVDVDLAMCRTVRRTVLVSASAALLICRSAQARRKNKTREVLDVQQVAGLPKTLVRNNASWAAC